MRVLAHFAEESRGGEQRGANRRALRLDIPGEVLAAGEAAVTILDLSLTGVLIQTSARLAAGESFRLELPEAGNVEATIMWTSGEYYGCQFATPISPAALSAALLKGEARPAQPPQRQETVDLLAELRSITAAVQKISAKVERSVRHLEDDREGKSDQ